MKKALIAFLFLFVSLQMVSKSLAQDAPATSTPAADAGQTSNAPEAVEVDSIKKRYWAQGDENELGVIQNRLYSKAHRFKLGVDGGVVFGDPFLTTYSTGFNFGYFFNESFGLQARYSILHTSPSTAYDYLEQRGAKANTNEPQALTQLEAVYSPLYGKLSLLGKKIIYYDFHLAAGGGIIKTQNGNYPAYSAGLGQRFYLSKAFSLAIDYRMVYYRETLYEREIPTKIGQSVGQRNDFSNFLMIGIDFMFGGP